MKIYALYKGDEFLTSGTMEELAEYLQVKIETIRFYMSPIYSRRGKGDKGNRKKVLFIGIERE